MCRSYKIDTRTSAEYCALTVHLPFAFSLSSACFAIFISLSLRPFKMLCFQLLSRAFLSYRGLSPERSSEQLLVWAPGWFRQVLVLGGSRHFETLCDVLVWVRSFVLGCRGSGDSATVWVQFPFCWGHLPLLSPVSPRSRPEFFFAFFLLCFYFYQLIAPRGISCHRWHEQFGRVSNCLEKARITYLCAQMPQVWWELLTYLILLTLLD